MLKKRYIITIIVGLVLFLALILYYNFAKYSDYSVDRVLRVENAGKTNYVNVFDKLISYNPDGVALLDKKGEQIWNLSFEMQDPRIETKREYVLLFDRQGTVIVVLDENGEVSRINASYPITHASISENGNIAVIMQQPESAHIVAYEKEGVVIAEGEVFASESGYPLSVSLSSNGESMAVSSLKLAEGDIKSEITFYDFSKDGSLKENNKASVFSYSDEVIPILDHVKDDKVLAIGSGSVSVFSNGAEPKVQKELFFEGEVKSVVHNEEYFGIVSEKENEEGNIINVLTLYTTGCTKRFSKEIDASYSKCEILDNNEIFLTDGKTATIYNSFGEKKFQKEFEGDVSSIIPAGGQKGYYLLAGGEFQRISLK